MDITVVSERIAAIVIGGMILQVVITSLALYTSYKLESYKLQVLQATVDKLSEKVEKHNMFAERLSALEQRTESLGSGLRKLRDG